MNDDEKEGKRRRRKKERKKGRKGSRRGPEVKPQAAGVRGRLWRGDGGLFLLLLLGRGQNPPAVAGAAFEKKEMKKGWNKRRKKGLEETCKKEEKI